MAIPQTAHKGQPPDFILAIFRLNSAIWRKMAELNGSGPWEDMKDFDDYAPAARIAPRQ